MPELPTKEQFAEQLGVSVDDLDCANTLADICNEVAARKYLDWRRDRELYFQRVESGYYDQMEQKQLTA